jgi:hypothetical protein
MTLQLSALWWFMLAWITMNRKAPFVSDNSLDTPRIAKIKGARGDALVEVYRLAHGDCTLLAFSRGKDSIATALALRGRINEVPFTYIHVPGLSFIERVLSWEFSCRFCTGFKLSDRALAERGIARQIIRVENAVHVAQAMPRDRGDLGLGTSDERKPVDGGAAQIMERETDNARLARGHAP